MLCEADSARRKGQHFGRSRAAASFGVGYVCRRRGRANAVRNDKITTIKFKILPLIRAYKLGIYRFEIFP